VLDASILTYAKNAAELTRGKKHGSMDIGMSVISTKASRRRIDIDADTSIIHIKVNISVKYTALTFIIHIKVKPLCVIYHIIIQVCTIIH